MKSIINRSINLLLSCRNMLRWNQHLIQVVLIWVQYIQCFVENKLDQIFFLVRIFFWHTQKTWPTQNVLEFSNLALSLLVLQKRSPILKTWQKLQSNVFLYPNKSVKFFGSELKKTFILWHSSLSFRFFLSCFLHAAQL